MQYYNLNIGYVKLRHLLKEGFLFYVPRRHEEPAQKLVDFEHRFILLLFKNIVHSIYLQEFLLFFSENSYSLWKTPTAEQINGV